MFTATIDKKEFHNGSLKVDVTYTDGSESITEQVVVTAAVELTYRIKNRIKDLDALKTFASNLAVGAYSVTPDAAPTQAEIDERDWFRDFARLESVLRLQAAGGMPAAWDADLQALKTKVQNNAKKAYIAKM